ncbi:nucleotidyltransferase family protein [Geminocystis herdmanii]|uniref:nucleotidyltransferase family protein n=1 Tax=Geminocystis herdmanii TaxID=669359 RepID=UPI001ED9A09C|nr:nucleotidyltransferase family protein [Geminocystis herdmanii]
MNINRESLINFIKQNLSTIKSYGVSSITKWRCAIAIFGSFARDECTINSDVDLLVEFEDKVTFDRYMDLKFFFEDNLGLSVDLVTKKMLKSQIINNVEKDLIYVS